MSENKGLWLLIEEKLAEKDLQSFNEGNKEQAILSIANSLDETGYNVSKNGGNLLSLRYAVDDMLKVGKPFMNDLSSALDKLKLEDLSDLHISTANLINEIGQTWNNMTLSERKPDIFQIMELKKRDLLIAKAKSLSGDEGIRLLIQEGMDFEIIKERMGISDDEVNRVNKEIEAEKAERARVVGLLEEVANKSDEEKIRHLINKNVTDALMIEVGGFSQSDVTNVNKKMEEEIKEKQRLAEEEAARKAAEAAGPPLEEIPPADMLNYIEEIRDIMEFSDDPNEIATMCEQSNIPKALIEVVKSDPAKLDELEKKANG